MEIDLFAGVSCGFKYVVLAVMFCIVSCTGMQCDYDYVYRRARWRSVSNPFLYVLLDSAASKRCIVYVNVSLRLGAALTDFEAAHFAQHFTAQREHFFLAGTAALNIEELDSLPERAWIAAN